ncbi:MAG: HD domain-containing protein [Clostridia bacterium]|jgi:putative nucleotidyltransferase with HDIG domain|nr:HD domain-containing protein [Clostridia bacterium]
MAIDILNAKKVFKEYVKNYNPEDEKVKIKIAHIERVTQIAKKLAQDLKLSQEDIELAELIGLLHDIGRFEQIRKYHTFIDKDSINHGEYGVKILFEEGLIRKFLEDNQYDEIIKLAILNHNKADIEENLNEKQKLHAKIIRDADKTDIFYILTVDDKKAIWESSDLSNDEISDEIYREFIEDKVINYKERKTSADILVSHFAYVYDFNFKETKQIILKNNYLDLLYKRFKFNNKETEERYNKIFQIAKKYLEEKG